MITIQFRYLSLHPTPAIDPPVVLDGREPPSAWRTVEDVPPQSTGGRGRRTEGNSRGADVRRQCP